MNRDPTLSDEEDMDPSEPSVVDKYKAAADVANKALKFVLNEIADGKSVLELCEAGDKLIMEEVGKLYNKGKVEKGLAFPTSISVNHCVGHYCPLQDDTTTLKAGDLVKVDLGAHIDGFIGLAAHSAVVGADDSNPITGRAADVIAAAYQASEAAVRLCRVGKTNQEVTDVVGKIAEAFNVNVVEGVLSHQMKRYIIDGNKCILNRHDVDKKVEEWKFEEHEVYAIDVVMSTGEGKPKDLDGKPSIFKRAGDQMYNLKMKASRQTLSEINSKFTTMPFPLRALDPKVGRFGITECLKHELIQGYPQLWEKEGDLVAHFKVTVIVMPNNILKISGLEPPALKSELEISKEKYPEVVELLATSLKGKKNKKKKAAAQ